MDSAKYIPLYRKYRPQTFHDLIGQENTAAALSNAIKLNRISHAYLLTGPRGTGKTSSARILAKSLNCKEGPTLNPCGKCPACLDVINSIPSDVIEIDAASNRSVEDTQALLEKIQYVPVNGRYKIYIIDEVHMLSNTAFNSLLKTLEEPPDNVIFILATTEPHKVLDTIISRCQRFDFKRITTADIVKRLEYISKEEQINISNDALHTIAKNVQGGMRDALSLLDQISVLGVNKQISSDDVCGLLGRISYDKLYDIAQCIINSDCTAALSLINSVYETGNEPLPLLNNLVQYFRDLMIIKNCSDKELIFSLTRFNEENYEKNKQLADKFNSDDIIQIIDRLSYYTSQTREASDKYLRLELCIMELVNYKRRMSAESLLKRIEALEKALESGAALSSGLVQSEKSVSPPVKILQNDKVMPNPPEPCPVQTEQSLKTAAAEKSDARADAEQTPAGNTDIHKTWVSILQSLASFTAKAYFQKAIPVSIENNRLTIAFNNDMFLKMADKNKKQALSEAAASYLGVENVEIEAISSADIPQSALKREIKASEASRKDLSGQSKALAASASETEIEVQDAPAAAEYEKKTDIHDEEEEEYQEYIEQQAKNAADSKETVFQKFQSSDFDGADQAEMVRNLFDGKYID